MRQKDGRAKIARDEHGVLHVEGANLPALYWGMGFAHARDRGMQLLLMRILGRGRASELIDGSDEMLRVDQYAYRQSPIAIHSICHLRTLASAGAPVER
jgi:penicillin G amidase